MFYKEGIEIWVLEWEDERVENGIIEDYEQIWILDQYQALAYKYILGVTNYYMTIVITISITAVGMTIPLWHMPRSMAPESYL